jgi:hypothetical protein
MRYDEIRNQLKTGDVVLFGGATTPFGLAIQLATDSDWTHVGLITRLSGEEGDVLALWESAGLLKAKDLQTGRIDWGVQLTLLSDRIRQHPGTVAVRPLKEPLRDKELDKLKELRSKWRAKPYERRVSQLIGAAFDSLDWLTGGSQTDISSFFCSELVAESFIRLGRFGKRPPSSEYTPADFDKGRKDWVDDILSEPIEVKA